MKLFLSAFEYAWAPFYFGLMKEPDAKETFSRVTTTGLACSRCSPPGCPQSRPISWRS